jgi:hypothetical protein
MDAVPVVRTQEKVFYGWCMVAGAFVVMFMGFGAAYAFGTFFHSLRDEFGATRQEVSLVFSLTAFLYFLLGAVRPVWATMYYHRWRHLG